MALSINPLAQLVTKVSSSLSEAANQAGSGLQTATASLGKLNLDKTMSGLSGASGSALGSFASAPGIGDLSSVKTAMGGIANQAQNLVSSVGLSAGSISNITGDIASSINKIAPGGIASGLASIAGQISGVAGQLNNLLSLGRAKGLPAGGELFQSRGAVTTIESAPASDWRVRINTQWGLLKSSLFKPLEETGGVVWPYLPTISLSSKANYTQIDPVHNNFPFQAYKNSQIDDITISGEFSCETEEDALYWIAATTFFRTATKMFYGASDYSGNPPIVCQLTGYGSSVFNAVPIIIKSFTVDFKDDTNYVKCGLPPLPTPTWVPIMSTISVVVSPVYNRSKLRSFSLQDFAAGNTVGYL